jgi:hypothetical protein
MPDATVHVRYMVDDVDAAIAWYTKHLGFEVISSASPHLPTSSEDRCDCCSAGRKARPGGRWPMVSSPSPADARLARG